MPSDGTRDRLGDLAIEVLPPGKPACVLTVDVEDWFHSNFRSAPQLDPKGLPRRVEEGVDRLLGFLASVRARATFFVLGAVAQEHPSLVRRIAEAGHEVGCHGMQHDLVYLQSAEAFERQVSAARKILSDQSGQPVHGFRAPSWSITERSLWALERLAAIGFQYDSSIFPAANYLYGIDGAPTIPYRLRTPRGCTLIEVPPPILTLGPIRLGIGGGLYLRAFPLWVQRRAMRGYARRGAPFITYLHPREFDSGSWQLRLPLSTFEQFLHRFGIRSVPGKIDRLMRSGEWQPMRAVVQHIAPDKLLK
jgi:polysaccharide deacetylase family protein (PEP-CTERM system associated)